MSEKSAQWRPGQTVCRCCLAEGCYKDISTEYFWMGKREVYADMLIETFDVSIGFSQSSGPSSSSRLICEPCISRLRDASEFKRQVQECERTFMTHLEPGSSNVNEIEVPLDDKDVKLEQVKQEKDASEDEFFDRDDFFEDDDDMDDEPLTKLATKIPKKESVDLLDLLDSAKVAEKRKATAKAKAPPAKKAKAKEAKPSPSKPKPVEKKKKDDDPDDIACRVAAALLLRHSTANPFLLWRREHIQCSLCPSHFLDSQPFREHMDEVHDGEDCTSILNTDPEKASTRVDVFDLSCKLCYEPVADLSALVEHLAANHEIHTAPALKLLVPVKLQPDKYECTICDRKLSGLAKLYYHSAAHAVRFVCVHCGKGFETRHGLLQHTRNNHTAGPKIFCRKCKMVFNDQAGLKQHYNISKACLPYGCNLCDQRFNMWEKREQHLVEIHDKPIRTFNCTECDRIFFKRIHQYRHFKEKHWTQHTCDICDRGFCTSEELKMHLHKHSGQKPYICCRCGKGFLIKKYWMKHEASHDFPSSYFRTVFTVDEVESDVENNS